MKIFIYPKAIDLGKVNVKSTERRNFCIKNEMTTHIIAKIDTKLDELAKSYQYPQIIPPFQKAYFDIVFCS
jgi:hypothetical protein